MLADVTPSQATHYRSDIDGLRALAVLAVVMYHLGLGCPGGYVGVDVFFVISGFLITRLLCELQASRTLTLTGFWSRRVRRLWPAMAVMLAGTCVAGWRWLLPHDFQEFGESLVAQATLTSNVYFWTKAGYFDTTANVKPLLHTWSLAIEEQFYLLFPLLFLARPRLTPARLRGAIVAIVVLSFGVSVYGSYRHPSAAFYLLPSRAWELGLGALVSLTNRPSRIPAFIRRSLPVVGLAAIVSAVFFYSATTRFPGIAALLPCAGTAFVLWAGCERDHIVSRALSLRPLVFIGLISYSLYLWHWPVIVLWTYVQPEPTLTLAARISIATLSFALATVSYLFIESPIRVKQVMPSTRQLAWASAITLSVFVALGAGVRAAHGRPSRLRVECVQLASPDVDAVMFVQTTPEDLRRDAVRLLSTSPSRTDGHGVDLLLWGDSHANSIALPIRDVAVRQRLTSALITHPVTAPLLRFSRTFAYSLHDEEALEFSARTLDYIRLHRIKRVVLAAAWNAYAFDTGIVSAATFDERSVEPFHRALTETVSAIVAVGADVWLVKDVPSAGLDVPRALSRACLAGDSAPVRIQAPAHARERVVVNGLLDSMRTARVHIVDPFPMFVDANNDLVLSEGSRPLFYDNSHLSVQGAQRLTPLFLSSLAVPTESNDALP